MYSRRAPTRHHCPLFATLGIAVVSGSFGLVLWLGIRGVLRGVAGQPLLDLRDGCHKALSAEGAFPDDGNTPTRLQEAGAAPLVPGRGCGELYLPVLGTRLWFRAFLAARVLVPEAPVHEADRAILWEDEIGLPGQAFPVKPVPEAADMEGLAQSELRLRVLAADGGHDAGSGCLVDDVCHGFSGFSVALASIWVDHTPVWTFSPELRTRAFVMYLEIPPRAFGGSGTRPRLKFQYRCRREPVGVRSAIPRDHAS